MCEEMKRSKEEHNKEKHELKKEIKSLKKNLKNLMKRQQRTSSENYLNLIQFKPDIKNDENNDNDEEDDAILDDNMEINLKQQIKIIENKHHTNISKIQHQANTRENSAAISINDELSKLRKLLNELNIGDEVLAKSTDDGWYYKCLVKEYLGNFKYKVEDVNKNIDELLREDIISELDAVNATIQVFIFLPTTLIHPIRNDKNFLF
jgi:hypothetical protein